MALILGVSCTGAAFAADQILTNQTIEGNGAAHEYALLIGNNFQNYKLRVLVECSHGR